MPKVKKPAQAPKKQSATDKMIAECVKRARARKRSGQTDSEWRQQYSPDAEGRGRDGCAEPNPRLTGRTTKKKT